MNSLKYCDRAIIRTACGCQRYIAYDGNTSTHSILIQLEGFPELIFDKSLDPPRRESNLRHFSYRGWWDKETGLPVFEEDLDEK